MKGCQAYDDTWHILLLIYSEIGDIGRFSDSYHLVSYVGLSPYSSGGNTYHGGIRKQVPEVGATGYLGAHGGSKVLSSAS
ncbi:MAG: transposase [Nitrososphaeria archaeon]